MLFFKKCFFILSFVLVVTSIDHFTQPNTAHAGYFDRTGGKRPLTITPQIAFGLWGGYSGIIGVRVGIPLIHNGFIAGVNNSLSLSVGGDFYWGNSIGIPIAAHWELYFSRIVSGFVELGLNVFLSNTFVSGHGSVQPSLKGWMLFALGINIRINKTFAITLRGGNPYGALGLRIAI